MTEDKPKKIEKEYNAQTTIKLREGYNPKGITQARGNKQEFELGQNAQTMVQTRNAKKPSDEKK